MKYEVIMEKGNYVLIRRGSRMEEYAVVDGLDKAKGEWSATVTYWSFGNCSRLTQAEALDRCLNIFRHYTENDYIGYNRLVELATRFKDYLIEADAEMAISCFNDECDMDDYEKEFFEIDDKMLEGCVE